LASYPLLSKEVFGQQTWVIRLTGPRKGKKGPEHAGKAGAGEIN